MSGDDEEDYGVDRDDDEDESNTIHKTQLSLGIELNFLGLNINLKKNIDQRGIKEINYILRETSVTD